MPPQTKRRKTDPTAVEEINFDLAARQEYLTGFHKRKVQRAKHAQEAAQRRARAERIEERKKLREERKADLERHVAEVNALLAPADDIIVGGNGFNSDEEEWSGLEEVEPPPVDHEAEYIDEDKYTTVTVEAMDVSKEGLFKAQLDEDENKQKEPEETENTASAEKDGESKNKKRTWTKDKPKDKDKAKARKKKRNFRYESKAERRVTRVKERSRGRKQARERRTGE